MKYWWYTPAFLSALLASGQAVAQTTLEPDPITYHCYYCTAEEKAAMAVQLGLGDQYIYDRSSRTIVGYHVKSQSGIPVAEPFPLPYWLQHQFDQLIRIYNIDRGEFADVIGTVALEPPGATDQRRDTRLWGQHLSALQPQHLVARETVRRMLNSLVRFNYFNSDVEHGRLLRFDFQLDDSRPIIARLNFICTKLGHAEFYFDHAHRRWEYLQSGDLSTTPSRRLRQISPTHPANARFPIRTITTSFSPTSYSVPPRPASM